MIQHVRLQYIVIEMLNPQNTVLDLSQRLFHLVNLVSYLVLIKITYTEKNMFSYKTLKKVDGSENSLIGKSNEVTVDILIGENGKLHATNVVTISILPGAINRNIKGDKTVSRCYILMAPSHTSFINTPSHVLQNLSLSKSNGR